MPYNKAGQHRMGFHPCWVRNKRRTLFATYCVPLPASLKSASEFAVLKTNILVTVFFALMLKAMFVGAEEVYEVKGDVNLSGQLGVGIGNIGLVQALSLSMNFERSTISARLSHTSNKIIFPNLSVNEKAIMYGKRFSYGDGFVLFSLGLSLVEESYNEFPLTAETEQWSTSAGVPIELSVINRVNSSFGFDMTILGNINSLETNFGFLLGLRFGNF